MSDALIVRDDEGTGYRFSWGLSLAGAAVAVAVTFGLLVLGSGVGLLFVKPESTAAHFFTGGAIYFVAAVAFGLALGGHVTGRLLGPLPEESEHQEEVRAALHGLVVWAVSVLATLGLVAVAGAATGAMYGVSKAMTGSPLRATQLAVDRLFRPEAPAMAAGGSELQSAVTPGAQATAGEQTPPAATVTPMASTDPVHARAEAGRLIEADFVPGARMDAPDRTRLIQLTAEQAHVPPSEARLRVAALESRLTAQMQQAAETARRTATATALWLSFALIFGVIIAMIAAVTARLEDDRETAWSWFAFHRGWRS